VRCKDAADHDQAGGGKVDAKLVWGQIARQEQLEGKARRGADEPGAKQESGGGEEARGCPAGKLRKTAPAERR
jgi:hypothetical protein